MSAPRFIVQIEDVFGDAWPHALGAKAFPSLDDAKAWVRAPEHKPERRAYVEEVCPQAWAVAKKWAVSEVTER